MSTVMEETPERVEQFKSEIGSMRLRDPSTARDRQRLRLGVAMMVVGVVLGVYAYSLSHGTDDGGCDVTESFDLGDSLWVKVWRPLGGFLRERRNRRDMLTTLERIKAVAEGSAA